MVLAELPGGYDSSPEEATEQASAEQQNLQEQHSYMQAELVTARSRNTKIGLVVFLVILCIAAVIMASPYFVKNQKAADAVFWGGVTGAAVTIAGMIVHLFRVIRIAEAIENFVKGDIGIREQKVRAAQASDRQLQGQAVTTVRTNLRLRFQR